MVHTRQGDAYSALLAEAARYVSVGDHFRAAQTLRNAIALRPDNPQAYHNLGAGLYNSEHYVEAAQRFVEAMERNQVNTVPWALATALAFRTLVSVSDAAKPAWWSDEGLKTMSARVVRLGPGSVSANQMRADVLCGEPPAWVVGPRSAAELKKAATHYEQAAALHSAPAVKDHLAGRAAWCRSREYVELMDESHKYASKQDIRRAVRALREAIALKPERHEAYYILGIALHSSDAVEAAQAFRDAKEHSVVGSEDWAEATAWAFRMLRQDVSPGHYLDKPEWWNDEELKALSTRVVSEAPEREVAHQMRADVLSGQDAAWVAGPRSAAELREAATHYERAAALCDAPAVKAALTEDAACCRRRAEAM